jgi:hypothetical protein
VLIYRIVLFVPFHVLLHLVHLLPATSQQDGAEPANDQHSPDVRRHLFVHITETLGPLWFQFLLAGTERLQDLPSSFLQKHFFIFFSPQAFFHQVDFQFCSGIICRRPLVHLVLAPVRGAVVRSGVMAQPKIAPCNFCWTQIWCV